jgi:hypothetical protein
MNFQHQEKASGRPWFAVFHKQFGELAPLERAKRN